MHIDWKKKTKRTQRTKKSIYTEGEKVYKISTVEGVRLKANETAYLAMVIEVIQGISRTVRERNV